jgi:hypothetical protein
MVKENKLSLFWLLAVIGERYYFFAGKKRRSARISASVLLQKFSYQQI